MPTDNEPALALALLRRAAQGTLIAVLRGAGHLDRVARLASILAEGVEVITLPPLDVLPYDLLPPSAVAVGRRVRALTELSRPADRPRLLLTSATAALQRVRPAVVWREATLTLAPGDALDLDRFRAALLHRAYHWDERVDEPGEVALRGQVIDIFPAGARTPARIALDGGRIRAIARIDPATQRTGEPLCSLELRPATEYRVDDEDTERLALRLQPEGGAVVTHLPRRLVPIFGFMPGAPVYCAPDAPARWRAVRDGIDDAYAAARKAGRVTGTPAADAPELPPPDALFLSADELDAFCAERADLGRLAPAIPPPRRLDALLEAVRGAGKRRVLVATPGSPEAVARNLARRGLPIGTARHLLDLEEGAAGVVQAEVGDGVRTADLLLVSVGTLLRPKGSRALAPDEEAPRCGEMVVHLEHGLGKLVGLSTVNEEDRVALLFAGDVEVLAGANELDRVWRYGEAGATPDRLDGAAWHRKRDEIEAELNETAAALAAHMEERAARIAPVLSPAPEPFARVAHRFPFTLSPDQRAAIHDVLADLGRRRPMDRLLCGDVGFGKTEVAIRAAAAAVFAGRQVAVVAPTTVLARQHLQAFAARFADSGVDVLGLIAASPAERRAAAATAAADRPCIVVGTQGVAGLAFAAPGLVVIDEEQRFGEADKARLASLAPHVLAMTATPIPRTLQEALVGLRDVSVLATPPQARQPSRTYVLPWDGLVVREALLRERRRGGQSFIVCPRIADLHRCAAELAELVPELAVVTAHGRMRAPALEAAVLDFAAGQGDVLLATDIIEAGLDIPRANLILVTDADRFGLAQLHQLRGRVGRGARTGSVYFLTEPGRALPAATARRLHVVQTLSSLGAGAAISSADLDMRGAGDLFGERQSGHVRAVGTALYHHLLLGALARRRGQEPPPAAPALHAELAGGIPAGYVPEEDLRLALLYRLARIDDPAALRRFALELDDRFGPPPPPVHRLLEAASHAAAEVVAEAASS